jgi:hypothetical protein
MYGGEDFPSEAKERYSIMSAQNRSVSAVIRFFLKTRLRAKACGRRKLILRGDKGAFCSFGKILAQSFFHFIQPVWFL